VLGQCLSDGLLHSLAECGVDQIAMDSRAHEPCKPYECIIDRETEDPVCLEKSSFESTPGFRGPIQS